MTLRKLEKRADGDFLCPECGKPLRFKDGEAVAVVDGQLDMDNYKPYLIEENKFIPFDLSCIFISSRKQLKQKVFITEK